MISLIHPSRGRPQKAFDTYREWVASAGVPVEYILIIDQSDPLSSEYINTFQCDGIYIPDSSSVVEATNHGAKVSTGDILVYLSDDFKCFPDWGKALEERIPFPNNPILLKIDDCLQEFRVGVVTMPIMTRALYLMLGYFFNPLYKSMHVDVDLYETCIRLGVIRRCPDLKFPHHHVSNGKAEMDETYRRSTAHWNQGLEVIARRRRLGFPI